MLASIVLVAQVAATPADFNWIAGAWLQCEPDREVSEIWTDARGGFLFNTSVTVQGGRASSERTMIAFVEGAPVFVYEPMGPNVMFRAVEVSGQRVVFENPENDFPQRIIYARDGDVLTARIEGTIDGETQSVDWTYQAAELNARCPES